jgi:glycosyltransferase involved in cell wall biosynthesis
VRILLFANTDWYLFNFRLPLAEHLKSLGHEVVLVSPSGKHSERLQQAGFRWHRFDFARSGANPLLELQTIARLTTLYKAISPDLVHHFTIKCILYGGIVARRLAIPSVAAITGLGHVFTTKSIKNWLLRPVISLGYRYALDGAHVIFQNPDDQKAFAIFGLRNLYNEHLIRGSGVDTIRFAPPSIHRIAPKKTLRVLFIGRLLREKGLYEYVNAAAKLKSAYPNVDFDVAGEPDEGNPSSITSSQIDDISEKAIVRFLGHCTDIPALLEHTDICVLPSYREGTPKSLLEAAASGLPLIATDVPGCREICRNNQNGILVPAQDVDTLANAISRLIVDDELRLRMGHRSREIAVTEFSQDYVIDETIKVYKTAMQQKECD